MNNVLKGIVDSLPEMKTPELVRLAKAVDIADRQREMARDAESDDQEGDTEICAPVSRAKSNLARAA